jgi:DNA-binding NtrC family response regulator
MEALMANQSARPGRSTDLYINCVVLGSPRAEFTFLHNVFGPVGIRMYHAECLDQADLLLTVTDSTVLLSDVVFEGGSWHDALSLLSQRHPLVTMLVIAEHADSPLLGDLFSRGACGVIWKPFEFTAVRRLIRTVHEASKERRALQEERSMASV